MIDLQTAAFIYLCIGAALCWIVMDCAGSSNIAKIREVRRAFLFVAVFFWLPALVMVVIDDTKGKQ